jgi:acetyltransferase-like isoleucine patch superfamily enzyme
MLLVQFMVVYSAARIFGISFLVKYLRNPNPKLTVRLLRSFGAKVGNGTTFKRSLFIDNAYEDENSTGDFSHIKIGDNCYIGDCAYFDLSNEICIEDNVVIAGRVSIITHADCNRSEYLASFFPRQSQQVRLCDGAWIGFQVSIHLGVTVGHHSVIAANSLVRGNVEPKTVYAGIPAKKVRVLGYPQEEQQSSLHMGNRMGNK